MLKNFICRSSINGTLKINAAAFAGDNTFKLVGDSATADIFHVVNTSTTAGATIDASGVTFNSTQDAVLYLEGAGAVGGAAAGLADTITGSAKNDVIIASTGADIIAGGEGTDTYNASALKGATVEGTGTGTSVGVVINLGTSAVTNTSVLAATGHFTANSITSVEGGKTAYLFAAAASGNSSVQQTLSSIENVIGTEGNDYIVGSADVNRLVGGKGADYIVGGASNDVFAQVSTTDSGLLTAGSGVTSTALLDVYSVASGDTIDLSGSVDTAASYDTLTAIVEAGNLSNTVTAANVQVTRGKYDAAAKTFTVATVAGGANAVMINYDDNAAGTDAAQSIVLVGVTALTSMTDAVITV